MITDIGLTVALQEDYVREAKSAGVLEAEVRALTEQALAGLRGYVGGAKPVSEFAVNLAGPEDDPIQGSIYGLTVAAKFDTDDLPGDCEAYRVYVTERGERSDG